LFGSDKAAVMGNLLRQEFGEIWRGDRFREFRRRSASGANALCRVCPYY
jgi:MoaA/NifB/PqqE/SkfB family radical SAM enzyme